MLLKSLVPGLFLLGILNYSFADQLVHEFDVQKEFHSDWPQSECTSNTETYLDKNKNNVYFHQDPKTKKTAVDLFLTYSKPQKKLGGCSYPQRRFRTGRLISNVSINTYLKNPYAGYIEIEAKMTDCKMDKSACIGVWPGLWLFNNAGKNIDPEAWKIEHDIIEMTYTGDPATLNQYHFTENFKNSNKSHDRLQRAFLHDTKTINLTQGFHRYGLRWNCYNNMSCIMQYTFDGNNIQAPITIFYDPKCQAIKGPLYDSSGKQNKFCTNDKNFYNAFVSKGDFFHIIFSLHHGNLVGGKYYKAKYPFTDKDQDKEVARMTVLPPRLYQQ